MWEEEMKVGSKGKKKQMTLKEEKDFERFCNNWTPAAKTNGSTRGMDYEMQEIDTTYDTDELKPKCVLTIKKIFNGDDKNFDKRKIYVEEDDNSHKVRKMFCLEDVRCLDVKENPEAIINVLKE